MDSTTAAHGPTGFGERGTALPACLEAPLTDDEQRGIAWQLGPLLLGAGLLGLGTLYSKLFPSQLQIGTGLQACAAVIVSIPIFTKGVRGFLKSPPVDLTEQLVSLAILASMVIGDFVTATLVPLFLELGHLFEERSSRGARAAIEGITKLHARRATRLRDEEEEVVSPEDLSEGDLCLVRPGEVIPADGEVVSGHSSVDQAPITGESAYESVQPGSRVFAGTINLDGLLRVRAAEVAGRSVLGRVLDLLRKVEASKLPVLRLIERYAGVYLPLVLAVAGGTLFLSGSLDRAITVLIVACPCALVLAGPAAMVTAMTVSTKSRILIKSSGFLETVAEIDTLVLDKTGTVTAGALSLSEVLPIAGFREDEVLQAAAISGFGSLHPVSRAALEAARDRGLEFPEAPRIQEVPGQGVVAESDEGPCRLGRASWLESEGLSIPKDLEVPEGPGAWVAVGDRVVGYLALRDRPRSEARAAIADLRDLGIRRTVLLTGDRHGVAERVAEELAVEDFVAEVLPEQKLEVVRREQEAGRKVMMVGDGVNDALALSGADVGVAVGARMNEVALGGADVALLSSDLRLLPFLLRLSERTRSIVVQNALIGTGFSVFMMALASLGIISPLVGALLHNAGALFVILNSSRLLQDLAETQATAERDPFAALLASKEAAPA